MKLNKLILVIITVILSSTLYSQDPAIERKVDSLFNLAQRNIDENDFEEARENARRILKIKPDYYDAWILIARIYSWDYLYDSAKVEYLKIIDEKPGYWDAVDGLIDVGIIDKQYDSALMFANYGLDYHPKDKNFLYKKADVLYLKGDYNNSQRVIAELLDVDPAIKKGRDLLTQIEKVRIYNMIRLEYNIEFYEKPWTRRWHLYSISYQRRTKIGNFILRANMGDLVKTYLYDVVDIFAYEADRFTDNLDFQYELEAYPKITKKSYLFINGAYGQRGELFPRFKGGLEYFQGLPLGIELSLGFRYFYFENGPDKDVWVYTGSITKYVKKYYFSFRPYFTPRNNDLEQAYFLEARRYLDLADNYIFAEFGYGITPDDPTRFIATAIAFDQKSYNARAGIQYLIKNRWLIWFQLGYSYEEYDKSKYRNTYKGGVKLGYYF